LKILLTILTAVFMLSAAAAVGAQDEIDVEPQALLDAAVEQLRSAYSFRLAIEQRGAPYQLALTFDGVNMLPATLQSAEAQIISPNELHISARMHLLIPLSMDIYSRGDRQWLSFPSGAPWLPLPAFEGFDVSRLLEPEDGIDKLMTELRDPRIAATDALTEDQTAWHIQAIAAGDAVEGLLFGFIEPQDDVAITAYITVEAGRLALIEILMLETAGKVDAEPSVWRIKFYDYDAPRVFDPPAG
jgi:hypothetical protein